MEFKLENFFPLYPTKSQDFNQINDLKEFVDNKLESREVLPTEPGKATKHQIIIRRLLSGYTRFDSLLLVHEMGTGKTCSAIQAIEQNLIEANKNLFNLKPENGCQTDTGLQIGPGLNGAIILTRGKTLMNNFMDELVNRCTTKYLIGERTGEVSKLSKKSFLKFYTFFTFEIFAKSLKKMSQQEIISKYNNKIIVIDEAHNLREMMKDSDKLDIYLEIHKFLHLLDNKKVLLLTGTPMKDGPEEIATLLNLILPADKQFPTQRKFLNEYFPQTSTIRYGGVADDEEFLKYGGDQMKYKERFKQKIYGYVSFLKAMDSTIKKNFVGNKVGNLKYYNIVSEYMSDYQSKIYIEAYRQDKRERGIYNNSRQASRFVFQDGTYGTEGFAQNVVQKRGRKFKLGKSLKRSIEAGSYDLPREEREEVYLRNIRVLSAQYASIIQSILTATKNGELSLVYNDIVRGSGLIVLSLLLEEFGFVRNHGSASARKSYGIFSNETTSVKEIRTLQKIFNSDENKNGLIMPVIFGSRVIAEGITLKNVIHEHVVPHWNGSETEQVIGRGWRLGSHEALLKEGKRIQLNVYRHAVFPSKRYNVESIDLIMYEISERKDLAISKVLRCLKEAAVDCELFKRRNEKSDAFNNTRECEYDKCAYTCSITYPQPSDYKVENYQVLYFREDAPLMFDILERHYKTKFVSTLEEILIAFSNYKVTKVEVVQLLYHVIYNGVPIRNVYGYPCYLYESSDVYYLSDNIIPFPSVDNIFLSYYTRYPKLFVKLDAGTKFVQNLSWFNVVLNDYFESLIPNTIFELNSLDYQNVNPKIVSQKLLALPNEVQQRILEVAVAARILEKYCGLKTMPPLPEQLSQQWRLKNQLSVFCAKNKFRTIILDHYKNYYTIEGSDTFKMAIVWFLSEIVEERAKEQCLYGSSLHSKNRPLWNEWKTCTKKERLAVDKERIKIQDQYKTDVGYYGLWNPKTNDFCIRDVRTTRDVDKRKVPSGKRCINWTKPDLTNLILTINIPLPKNAMLPNVGLAKREIEENKYLQQLVKKLKQPVSDETLRKVVFWYGVSRQEICAVVRRWFEENNLMVEDNSCGVQTKRK